MPGQPAQLRRQNAREVFEVIARSGVASRAGVARDTGMSAPTVGKAADALVDRGFLEETLAPDVESAAPGRPARWLQINRSARPVLAIQLGVHRTRLARLGLSHDDDAWTESFPTPASAATWRRRLASAVERLSRLDRQHGPARGVALSLPGIVDEHQGRALLSPNLHWIESVDFPAAMASIIDAPLCVVHEIRALAMGRLAAQPDDRDFLLVDFGAGVGGAAVIDGRLFQPSLPMSGELGHVPAPGNRRPCGCGGVGCVETLLSRRGLLASFRQAQAGASNRSAGRAPAPAPAPADDTDSDPAAWRRLVDHVLALSAGHAPDARLPDWLADALDHAAIPIAGALNTLGLNRVIITGSLTELGPAVMDRLTTRIRQGAMWARFGQVNVDPAPRQWTQGLVRAAIDRLLLPIDADPPPASPGD